jgi:hypothetical protein
LLSRIFTSLAEAHGAIFGSIGYCALDKTGGKTAPTKSTIRELRPRTMMPKDDRPDAF